MDTDLYPNVDRWQHDIIGRYGHLIHSTGGYTPAHLLQLHQAPGTIKDPIIHDMAVGVSAQVALLQALDTEGFIHPMRGADFGTGEAANQLAVDKPIIEVFDPPLEAIEPDPGAYLRPDETEAQANLDG